MGEGCSASVKVKQRGSANYHFDEDVLLSAKSLLTRDAARKFEGEGDLIDLIIAFAMQ